MALTLPLETWGRGAPAVFLHGFTGSRASWRHLAPLLGAGLEARCLSLPGHDGVPVPERFDDVVEAIAASIPRPSVLVGYSQGARLALAVAARFPDKVTRLVLESGTPGLRRRHERTLRRAADAKWIELLTSPFTPRGVEGSAVPPSTSLGLNGLSSVPSPVPDAFLEAWESLPLFKGLQALPPAHRAELRARRSGHRADGLAAALGVFGTGAMPPLWSALPSLRIPTLLLTGRADLKFTHLARRMAAELPLAWRKSFRGVGHAPHLECPEAWAHEVLSFLAARHTDTLAEEQAA
jgi:2-succinyl-6-hydroxy-2,4-cyclohexadiene-1-carboxylate synthase